jgi:transposase-like protein
MVDCPHCGSSNTEWLDIVGDVADPQGSIYKCTDCGSEFDDLPDMPAWKRGGGDQ